MIRIHTLLLGLPKTLQDENGTWYSAIFRQSFAGPVQLEQRGLAGDQVADTRNHGSLNQAVCCHPLDHYAYWNAAFGLDTPERQLGPGSVGENWTLSGATEGDICVGDIYRVGSARVQVTAPRYPCMKQERKVGLPGFLNRTKETMRTGFYLRVLTPGTVQAGDELKLEERMYPEQTIYHLNACVHQTFDPAFAERSLAVPELAEGWKRIIQMKRNKEL